MGTRWPGHPSHTLKITKRCLRILLLFKNHTWGSFSFPVLPAHRSGIILAFPIRSSGNSFEVSQDFQREAGEIWCSVLAELKTQVSISNYRLWLEKTAGLGYHNNDFIVGANSSSIIEYLSSNLRSLLEKTLIEVTQKDYRICFLDVEKDITWHKASIIMGDD